MIGWLIDWLKAPDVVKVSESHSEAPKRSDFDELAELLERGATDSESLSRIAHLLGQDRF